MSLHWTFHRYSSRLLSTLRTSTTALAHPQPLPSHLYSLSVQAGRLKENIAQRIALPSLDRLATALPSYEREIKKEKSALEDSEEVRRIDEPHNEKPKREPSVWNWIGRFWGSNEARGNSGKKEERDALDSILDGKPLPPQGLYLYGDVGAGKTMLMDMLFQAASSRCLGCKRVHFHEFMLDAYKLMHEYDKMDDRERNFRGFRHPLDAVVGLGLIETEHETPTGLLCFDEFQVGDVGDARLVMGILTRLLSKGVVVVFTSNRPPWEINRSQLQNEEFAPLLDLMHKRSQFVKVDAGVDFRREAALYASGKGGENDLDNSFARMSEDDLRQIWKEESSGCDWTDTSPVILPLTLGRELAVENALDELAHFSFSELCDSPLGSDEYSILASKFRLVFISDVVPQMSPDNREIARRFIKLVDALYETGSRIIMRTQVPVSNLFMGKPKSDEMDILQAEGLQFETESFKIGVGAQNRLFGMGTLYSGEDEIFAFRRAVSRLYEMQIPAYSSRRSLEMTA